MIRIRELLDACALSLQYLGLGLKFNGVEDQSPEKISEQIDLSGLNLSSLRFSVWCVLDSNYAWIPRLLSSLTSYHITHLLINFHVGKSKGAAERLSVLLHRLETEGDLAEIDCCLSTCYNIRQGKLQLGLAIPSAGPPDEPLRISDDEWSKLVRGKMPRADKRGILRFVVTFLAHDVFLLVSASIVAF
ncbi:uncharacterized protein B0H18DRAFT_1120976 [Fomitopsis serialis]|uniref:uncharacterized protein n=1 Tax=Fomitopsis serialis TaxID=139415 RepID=UPI0020088D78|nr:uncharacterized protein B0H18DRAFT_1120976 [Neoantrodia serialis]KAH9922421.1 hypothetical protein B0H18DRAFT_1120976 [Neoantrodia serialis]